MREPETKGELTIYCTPWDDNDGYLSPEVLDCVFIADLYRSKRNSKFWSRVDQTIKLLMLAGY